MKTRRILSLFILFLSLPLYCFAVGEEPQNPSTALTIRGDQSFNVILQSTDDMSSYEFGFSSSPVTQWSTNPTAITSVFTLKPYIDYETGDSYATLENNQFLYVYWKMYTLKEITLTLKMSGPLKVNKQGSTAPDVDWYVYWDDIAVAADGGSASYDLQKMKNQVQPKLDSSNKLSEVLRVFPKLLTLQTNSGCTELKIVTGLLEGKSVDGKYEGSLVLSVSVK